LDPQGNVIVPGRYTSGLVNFGCTPLAPVQTKGTDALLAKLEPFAGGCMWSKRFGNGKKATLFAAASDGAGHVIVTGNFDGTVDFGGSPLQSSGGDDVVVAAYDAGGGWLWSKNFGDGSNQTGGAVAANAAGQIVVGGWFQGNIDFGNNPMTSLGSDDGFVAMLDPGGGYVGSTRFGDTGSDAVHDVAFNAGGDEVAITGEFSGTIYLDGPLLSGPLTSAGGTDVVVATLDAACNPLWRASFGGPEDQLGLAVGFDGAGDVHVAGSAAGSINFGNVPILAKGVDIFVATIVP
jgi:hypothetical protein